MTRPIVLNGRAAARTQITGVERWARELLERLPQRRPGAYRMLAPPPQFAQRAGQVWEQGVLPTRAAAFRAAVVFSPANLAPLAWPRNVVVMHDAVALSHPEWYSGPYVAWYRLMVPRIARRALRVITDSSFSRDELIALTGVDPAAVSVVPGGVDERFDAAVDPGPARVALGLDRPYVLTVGGGTARKNLGALGEIVRELDEQGIDVVTIGGQRGHHARKGAAGIRDLGYVSDPHVPGLYAGALAFVMPSLHEGFGLPCLEAMRSGVPVAAAARGALPETCGGAALLFDPTDRDATGEAVLRVVSDGAERARLRAAGLARARGLTWDRTARTVDRILAEVAAQAARPSSDR